MCFGIWKRNQLNQFHKWKFPMFSPVDPTPPRSEWARLSFPAKPFGIIYFDRTNKRESIRKSNEIHHNISDTFDWIQNVNIPEGDGAFSSSRCQGRVHLFRGPSLQSQTIHMRCLPLTLSSFSPIHGLNNKTVCLGTELLARIYANVGNMPGVGQTVKIRRIIAKKSCLEYRFVKRN